MEKLDEIRKIINEIDKDMAILFEKRMNCSKEIAKIKLEEALPVYDSCREKFLIENNSKNINDVDIKKHYVEFLNNVFGLSKEYQTKYIDSESRNVIHLNLKENSYDVVIKKGGINNINNHFNVDRKVLVITDDGVPSLYLEKIVKEIKDVYVYVINQGEKNKSFDNYEKIMSFMIEKEFSRVDCVIALGGGVVGDLAGFVASTFMRGIDFYNIPTTLLSQVDSSIGGKCAINLNGIKNIVGAFYQPKKVLIDSEVLTTLNKRQLHSGLVEAIKMGATSDVSLFELIENSDNLFGDIDEIIYKSLLVKKDIVEKDQFEANIRKVLNFGHTIGHIIESKTDFSFLHGECVGIGMLYFSSTSVKEKIIKVLKKYDLPTRIDLSLDSLIDLISMDKKRNGDNISVVKVNEIGKYIIENVPISNLKNTI